MKTLGLILVLAVAAHLHVAVTAYGVPLSVPLLWFAAAIIALPFAAVVVAGRLALVRNRPRFYWNTVIA